MDRIKNRMGSIVLKGIAVISAVAFMTAPLTCYAEEQSAPAADPAPAASAADPAPAVPAADPAPVVPADTPGTGGGEVPAAPADPSGTGSGETPAAPADPSDTGSGENPAAPADPSDVGAAGKNSGTASETDGSSGSAEASSTDTNSADGTSGDTEKSETDSGSGDGDADSQKKESEGKAQAAVWYYYSRGRSYGTGVASDASASKRKIRKVLLTDETRKCVERLNALHPEQTAADGEKTEGAAAAAAGKKSMDTIEQMGSWTLCARDKKALDRLLAAAEKDGYHIGILMIDIKTGKGIAVNSDRKFYGASSIKGPFIVSLAALYPQTLEKQNTAFKAVAVNSDNGSYSSLVGMYGRRYYDAWREAVGAEAPLTEGDYASLTAEDLARLWLLNYQYITGNPTYGEQIGELFETPNRSAIQPVLGKSYKTQTKGGWIAERVRASADAGIVYAGKHPYILAIVSDYPSDLKKLEPFVKLMNRIHTEITENKLTQKRILEYVR